MHKKGNQERAKSFSQHYITKTKKKHNWCSDQVPQQESNDEIILHKKYFYFIFGMFLYIFLNKYY